MKVTWSIPVFSQGLGSGRGDLVRARALIDALRTQGHQLPVVEARSRSGRQMEESLHRGGVGRLLPSRARLALRDAAWWWRSRGHGARVAEAAREQGAEVLVETQVHGVVSGAVASRATGLPLVLDGVSPPSEVAHLGAGLPGLSRPAFRTQCEAASLLVTPSPRIREIVTADGPASRTVEVIPNGVDLEAHRRASRDAARRRLGLRNEVVVCFVGSSQPWHDVPLLVRAFAALDAPPPLRLLLVGDGPGREAALARARELDVHSRVEAPGMVPPDRVPGLLAACDIGALAGTNGYGHPMKLLEYGAAGLSLVAPDLPPVRQIVGDRVSGVLFDPGEAASLTRALARLANAPELRRRLGKRARTRVARGSTWGDRGCLLARALEEAAASTTPGPPLQPSRRSGP